MTLVSTLLSGVPLVGRGLALAALIGLAGCEPSGPGSLTAIVQAPGPAGALVIELTGIGITGFEGVGAARTFDAPAAPGSTARRVVVVSSTGTAIRFRIKVEDVSGTLPTAAVVSGVDLSNQPIPSLSEYGVRISR
ncbi:MAG: hypothetical protein EXR95_09995 [Gemmatimonadetes bacterium]|nr:hypothetical protein [Gemmatimonadota bacterium]